MSRQIEVAAIRLSNEPGLSEQRLGAAAKQVLQAAERGAQLVVLPEVFNTGYHYHPDNYARAESFDGPTVTWMKRMADAHHVHLAGSLLLRGDEDITNTLVLVAPDGRTWRYEKNHPWVWERAYFREGRDITIAHTDLGTFGLLICADVMAPRLFTRYAGRVDALIICASPPRMHELMLTLPDGTQSSLADLLGMPAMSRRLADRVFGEHVRGMAAWLGVPVVQTTPFGTFSSRLPAPRLSMLALLARRPSLWRTLPQAGKVTATGSYFAENQIVGADGSVLARYDAETDGFAFASVALAESPPSPRGRRPAWLWRMRLLHWGLELLSWLLIPTYRRGVRRAWGRHMAPTDMSTFRWRTLMGAAMLAGFGLGRRRRCRRESKSGTS
jgi:hypothetical protein